MPLLLDGAQRSEEWFAARKGRITASLAAGCLGLDPYCSPRKAWKQITTGGAGAPNRAMLWGVINEGTCRAAYEEETGNLAFETGFWVHPEYPWLGASPDGLVLPNGLLECKCPYKLPAGPSEAQRLQMLVQLAVCERAWVDFYCWTPSATLLQRVLRPAATVLDNLVSRLKEFYDAFVVTGVQPPRRKRKCQ